MPSQRTNYVLFTLILITLISTSCGTEAQHPKEIPADIEFNQSLQLKNPQVTESFNNTRDISLWLYNNSGEDITVADDEIAIYIIDGDNFTKVENQMENSFHGVSLLPGVDDLGKGGRIAFFVSPDVEVKSPLPTRIYSFGKTNDGKMVGAFIDVELK